MTSNMTKGRPWKLILLFALPIFLGSIFQQLYGFADATIVGRTLGYKAFAAVGAAGYFIFLFSGFVQGFTLGFTIPISQRFGAGDEEGMRFEAGTAVMLSVFLTALITIISCAVSKPVLELMNTPPDVIEESYKYSIVIFSGLSATMLYNVTANIFRAVGDSKTPLVFLVFASVLNIAADLLFISVFKLGVIGAGLATVIAQLLSGVLCIIVMAKKLPALRLKRKHFSFNLKRIKRQLTLGIPMALQQSINCIGLVILQSALNNFGSEFIAGHSVAGNVELFAGQGIYAISSAVATYTAQNYGAKKFDRVRSGIKAGTLLGFGATVLGMLILFFLCKPLSGLFIDSPTPKIVESAQLFCSTSAVFYFLLSLLCVTRNVLQGMGKSFVPMLGGGIELVARAFVSIVLVPHLGYLGICLAAPFAWAFAAIPMIATYFYHSKRLLKKI